MNIYASYLNMDQRLDRRDHMERELKRVGINAERRAGLPPSAYNLEHPKYAAMVNRTPGAIGCYEGQMAIMREALKRGQDAMILEDDLVFCSDFTGRLQYIDLWTAGREWDVIWLGATFHSPAFWHRKGESGMRPNCSRQLGKDCETTDDPRMIRTYGAFSTHAYIVNVNSIQKVLDELDRQMPTSIGIDYSFIRMQPNMKAFSFVPGCVKQIDNESNIGTGITRWSGFLKLNGTFENSAYVWQDRMCDFDPSKFNWL
jgi:GR25 family glycosyltransferase involved in LPS biosynthesis